MARTRRTRKVSVPDLRLALGFMCFTSFILTFLYVDTADLSDNSNNLLPYDESQFEIQEERRKADDLLSSLDAGNTRVDTTIQEEGEGDESLLLQEDDEGIAEPEVLTIQPFHGPATGGMLVSIHGHNLKGSRGYGEPTAYVGGQPCSVTTVVEQEEITCITPAGVGSRLSVRVVLHRQDGDVEFGPNGQELPQVLGSKDNTLFSYDDPSVDSVTPDHGQTSGGTRLTIEGANFGQPEAAGGVEAIVGGTPCIETEHVSDKEVVCVSPPGTAGARSVVVMVGSGEHKTESKRNYLFAYIMTPEERLNLEAGSLLDGLLVRYDRLQMHLVMHRMSMATTAKGVLTNSPHEYTHRDLFSGRTSVYNIPPELMSVIPEDDFKPQYPTCAVVGNSGILLDACASFHEAPPPGGLFHTPPPARSAPNRGLIPHPAPPHKRHHPGPCSTHPPPCAAAFDQGRTKRRYGEAIDGAHAVFRFNNAPTTNYERHVGSKTTFRMAETRFVRALLARDPQQRKSGWRPTNKQTLLVWSEYAQDLYVQVGRPRQARGW
ncbi:hypothetical protein CYMTET_32887 [Cymbomonas tetramitiformis]|uniref:IPT/TIG domain-containing protein n=1 Tax=Cymbomonas tetramitiformis TaxID=36881 RepID=A0AAE0FE69_9CHLO|nr:hypothetical protein CYMTET_32887 [Cymbomonas tetramitiformis]